MKQNKIKKKTRKEIEQDIENVLNGKDKSQRGKMLRMASKPLLITQTKEEVKKMFVDEYVKKYGLLEKGKISVKELKKQSLKEIEQSKKGLA